MSHTIPTAHRQFAKDMRSDATTAENSSGRRCGPGCLIPSLAISNV